MSMGPRAYATILLTLVALAAVAFVKRPAGDIHVPAGSLTDQPGAAAGAPQPFEILYQPTILRADSAASPKTDPSPMDIPARLSTEPSRADWGTRDWGTHSIPTHADLAPTEFLTIPSLEPPQRR